MAEQGSGGGPVGLADDETGVGKATGAPGALERGQPSPGLRQAMEEAAAQESGGYQRLTDAASEQGIFDLVGGYLDENGEVHKQIHLRSLDGEDEDLLGNRGVRMVDRLATILGRCIQRIGTITDRGLIQQAVNRLPIGARTHALICLRRVTHWKTTKDRYDMDVRCPECEKVGSYALDLSAIQLFEMPEPNKREFGLKLLNGQDVVWRVACAPQERILGHLVDADDSSLLSYAIAVRIVSIDGQDMRLSASDLLTDDMKKIKLSKRGAEVYNWVRRLPLADRDILRAAFVENEPAIDTNLDFDCQHCHKSFSGDLDVNQESFWFPSATSTRSKKRSSS